MPPLPTRQFFSVLGVGVMLLGGCTHVEPRFSAESVMPPPVAEAPFEAPEPLPQQALPVPVTDAAPETPVPLTRDGALLTSLLHNRSLEVAELGPGINRTYVEEERAFFDPALLATASAGHESREASATTSATSSSAASGGEDTGILSQTIGALRDIQRLNNYVEGLGNSERTSDDVTATGRFDQRFETGTQIFLSGSLQKVDSNQTGTDSGADWELGVAQPLLRGAGRAINLIALREAQNLTAQSEHVLRENVLQVVRDVEQTYWQLALAEELLSIRAFAVQLARAQMQREQELFDVGKAIQGDIMAAQAEVALREADLADADAGLRTQSVTLVELMDPESAGAWHMRFTAVDRPEVAPVEVDESRSDHLALQYRPELAQTKLAVANLDLEIARTRNGLLPRLDIVATYGEDSGVRTAGQVSSTFSSGRSEASRVGLELETSLTNRAERARYRRARLENRQGERQLSELEHQIGAQVRRAIIEVNRQWQRIQATTQAVESQTETMRVITGRRDVGKATNLDVLQVQRDLIFAQVEHATARVGYIQALTNLYAVEGTLLERRGISFEQVATRAAEAESESE